MKISDRIAMLTDWAMRDEKMGMAQARRDEAKLPGILEEVERQLALRRCFAREDFDWAERLEEIIPLPEPKPKEKKQ